MTRCHIRLDERSHGPVITEAAERFGVLQAANPALQVLRAPFAHVVLAETALKRLHQEQIAGRSRRGMISSFGQGAEVARRKVPITLTDVLPHGEDVTNWFR
jgi:hypothetical protein